MGQQIEITDEQEKVIQLIKTWDVQNIKFALLMDDSQGLGVQELYSSFIIKWGHLFHDQDPSPQDLAFPVHSLLFHNFILWHTVDVPTKVKTRKQLISFLIDYYTLIGFEPDSYNNVYVHWFHGHYYEAAKVHVPPIEVEVEMAFYKGTGTKIDFDISLLAF